MYFFVVKIWKNIVIIFIPFDRTNHWIKVPKLHFKTLKNIIYTFFFPLSIVIIIYKSRPYNMHYNTHNGHSRLRFILILKQVNPKLVIPNGKYASLICCESSHKMGDIVDPIVHEVKVRSIKSYPQNEMTFISSCTSALWKLFNVPH